jgi:hypothetical protein
MPSSRTEPTGDSRKSRWQQLGTQTRMKEFPELATVRILADVLEVDETSIVLSVAASLGIDVRLRGPLFAQLLPAGTDLLSPRVRDAFLALLRAAVADAAAHADEADAGHGAHAEPETYEWAKTASADGSAPNVRTGDHSA